MAAFAPATFATLLESAVTEPGIISTAYRQFHTYSVGNQLLAWSQCLERGIQPGPIATFVGWKDKGRHVKKGEKAITLCQPVKVKRTTQADEGTEDPEVFMRFINRPHWFVLAQTEGQELPPVSIPAWDRVKALETLGVSEVPFDAVDGNVMGFARERSIAVSPLNQMAHRTTMHELAHCCSATRQKANRPTANSHHAVSANAKRNLWRCCAVRLWTFQASNAAGATFNRGGVLEIRFQSGQHSAF